MMKATLSLKSMMKQGLLGAALLCGIVGAGNTAHAAEAAAAPASPAVMAQGEAVFQHYCTVCHERGVGHPGTEALGFLYGKDKAALADRDSSLPLVPDFVRYIVRNGRGLMPAFRMAELNNQELDALAAYLSAGPHPAVKK
jgi:mono/diheme cytochrome c family protein